MPHLLFRNLALWYVPSVFGPEQDDTPGGLMEDESRAENISLRVSARLTQQSGNLEVQCVVLLS